MKTKERVILKIPNLSHHGTVFFINHHKLLLPQIPTGHENPKILGKFTVDGGCNPESSDRRYTRATVNMPLHTITRHINNPSTFQRDCGDESRADVFADKVHLPPFLGRSTTLRKTLHACTLEWGNSAWGSRSRHRLQSRICQSMLLAVCMYHMSPINTLHPCLYTWDTDSYNNIHPAFDLRLPFLLGRFKQRVCVILPRKETITSCKPWFSLSRVKSFVYKWTEMPRLKLSQMLCSFLSFSVSLSPFLYLPPC